ncbi:hypothetical protein FHR83_009197 [Actinoplanes campanulatus]|uniref:Uncharacterized protein n=1 Tax=Actinoplanes campanulatus TaxID=113559 RepID=A0A7W5FK44_9ACTN|nr:hypothetical protein [Actinoplanes campanulatus]MBB3101468.1 hypothetical protein [Actinoplanes campanulatus]
MLIAIGALALFIAILILLLPREDTETTPDGERKAEAAGDGVVAPTTLEGALVAQLVHGEITRTQYHAALAGLAARDDERNPLSAPGNDRPDACA